MKTHPLKTMAAAFVCACAGLSLLAYQVQAADPASTLKAGDEKFVKAASQQGMGEVQVAALGVRKSARADVKELAEMLVNDHTAANTELTTLAKGKGVMVSAVTDPKDTEKLKDLENKATGEEFDKAFLEQLKDDHEEAIALYEDAAEDSENAEVKAFAAKTLPTLRAHLDKVKALQK